MVVWGGVGVVGMMVWGGEVVDEKRGGVKRIWVTEEGIWG